VKLEEQRNLEPTKAEDTSQSDSSARAEDEPEPRAPTVGTVPIKAKSPKDRQSDNSDDDSDDSEELNFDMADDIVPLDETAESTLRLDRQAIAGSKKPDSTDSEEEEPAWLKKVATLVNSKAPKANQKKSKKTVVGGIADTLGLKESEGVPSGGDNINSILPSEISRPVPLLHVQKQFRHGCKVVNMKDKKRVVGQVKLHPLYCNSLSAYP